MLETMYAVSEQNGAEAESVMDFCRRFIKGDDMEDKFYEAIRDTRLVGFKEGMKAALSLFSEVR